MGASSELIRTSRVGKVPITVPKGVEVKVAGDRVEVKGPKGTLKRGIPASVSIAQDKGILNVSSSAPGRNAPRLQGLMRALVANMVEGVSVGYKKELELHGTGYRVELKGRTLHCSLGFSRIIPFELPAGVNADIPKDSKGAKLILEGMDKEKVGQAAATIRAFRPPEPYGGKGVRYKGERIREKAGKTGK